MATVGYAALQCNLVFALAVSLCAGVADGVLGGAKAESVRLDSGGVRGDLGNDEAQRVADMGIFHLWIRLLHVRGGGENAQLAFDLAGEDGVLAVYRGGHGNDGGRNYLGTSAIDGGCGASGVGRHLAIRAAKHLAGAIDGGNVCDLPFASGADLWSRGGVAHHFDWRNVGSGGDGNYGGDSAICAGQASGTGRDKRNLWRESISRRRQNG